MRSLALRTKLLGALLGVGLLTLLVTGWQAYRRAERRCNRRRLTTSRRSARSVGSRSAYFASVRQDGLRLAESHEIIEAMREFKAAYRAFEAEVAQSPQDARDRSRADVGIPTDRQSCRVCKHSSRHPARTRSVGMCRPRT